MKTIVLFFAMHRSGSSATCAILHELGINLGPSLLPPDEFNRNGYWEHTEIVDCHDRLLKALGRRWDTMTELPAGWMETGAAREAYDCLDEILERDFKDSPCFGIKDPRLCLLGELWMKLIADRGLNAVYLHQLRHPWEVAESLERREDFSAAKSVLLWYQHVIQAFRLLEKKRPFLLDFDELNRNTGSFVQNLARHLPESIAEQATDRLSGATAAFDPALVHDATLDSIAEWVGPFEEARQRILDGTFRSKSGSNRLRSAVLGLQDQALAEFQGEEFSAWFGQPEQRRGLRPQASIYWPEDGSYSENRKTSRIIRTGDRNILRARLSCGEPEPRIRFDPAETTGQFRLFRIALVDSHSNRTLHSFLPRDPESDSGIQVSDGIVVLNDSPTEFSLAAFAPDPILILPKVPGYHPEEFHELLIEYVYSTDLTPVAESFHDVLERVVELEGTDSEQRLERDRQDRDLSSARQQAEAAKGREKAALESVEQAGKEANDLRAELDRSDRRIRGLEGDLRKSRELASAREKQVGQLEQELRESHALAAAREKQIGQLEQDLRDSRDLASPLEDRIERLEQELRESRDLASPLEDRIERLEQELRESRDVASPLEDRIERLEQELRESRDNNSAREQRMDRMRSDIFKQAKERIVQLQRIANLRSRLHESEDEQRRDKGIVQILWPAGWALIDKALVRLHRIKQRKLARHQVSDEFWQILVDGREAFASADNLGLVVNREVVERQLLRRLAAIQSRLQSRPARSRISEEFAGEFNKGFQQVIARPESSPQRLNAAVRLAERSLEYLRSGDPLALSLQHSVACFQLLTASGHPAPSESAETQLIRDNLDVGFYLERNPDVAQAGGDPIHHYLHHGWEEGRRPTEYFDPAWYLKNYPEVAATGREPFTHFLTEGVAEERYWPCQEQVPSENDEI